MTKQFIPKVATTNHVLEGDVIYFTQPGWSRRLEEAAIAMTQEEADRLLDEARQYPEQTVGIVLTDVDVASGFPQPAHFRERIRTQGPSNYFHGKQADHV